MYSFTAANYFIEHFLLALFIYGKLIYLYSEITGIKFTKHKHVFGYITAMINLISKVEFVVYFCSMIPKHLLELFMNMVNGYLSTLSSLIFLHKNTSNNVSFLKTETHANGSGDYVNQKHINVSIKYL